MWPNDEILLSLCQARQVLRRRCAQLARGLRLHESALLPSDVREGHIEVRRTDSGEDLADTWRFRLFE